MTKKWLNLAALVFGGSTVLQIGGCLNWGGFWEGIWGTGWPTNNPWLNIGIDVIKEELFG